MKYSFIFLLFTGLVIRLLLVGNPGFVADVAFWKSWSIAPIDHGIVWTAHNTNINYPPGFIYVLWVMGKLYSLIGDPHNYNVFWRENNFGFLLVSKSIAIVSDIIIACLIYWFFSLKKVEPCSARFNLNKKLPLFLSAIFYLNPVVILDSALWGQVESFGILFTLTAIILLFYRKPLLASFIFTVGTQTKLQNIIYIPLFYLFIYRFFDLKTVFKSLGASVFSFFLVNLPFVLANDMNQVLYLLTINSDYFPWLSLNAHNLWWIVAQGSGMGVVDKITVLGILNAKTVGLVIFSFCYLLSAILIFLKPTPRNLFLSLTLAIFAFFLFTTQSHERYCYPIIVLLLFLYPFLDRTNQTSQAPDSKHQAPNKHQIQSANNQKLLNLKFRIWSRLDRDGISTRYFWLLYLFLTIAIFFNLHTGLIFNYPLNGFQMLTKLTTRPLTIVNSYFLIILFFMLFSFIFSQISYLFLFLCSSFLVLSLIALNFSYLVKRQVSLSSFKPVVISQDFGITQTNMSLNSASGWKSWNRLSNNYFFYREGFGTHANSNLVFDIDRKFSVFKTDYGIDTEAATPATVVFKIYGDDKELFQSKKMGRFDFPGHSEVNVTGVKHLKLVVTDAGDGINSDHADWLNPILFK